MKLFRVFCWRMYFENKDEYAEWGEPVPHSFEEYVGKNLGLLKKRFREIRYASN